MHGFWFLAMRFLSGPPVGLHLVLHLFFEALLLLIFVSQVAIVSPPCVPMRSLLLKIAVVTTCVGLGWVSALTICCSGGLTLTSSCYYLSSLFFLPKVGVALPTCAVNAHTI
jgi:hypothetical protein